jgi:hypothetical protein
MDRQALLTLGAGAQQEQWFCQNSDQGTWFHCDRCGLPIDDDQTCRRCLDKAKIVQLKGPGGARSSAQHFMVSGVAMRMFASPEPVADDAASHMARLEKLLRDSRQLDPYADFDKSNRNAVNFLLRA